MAKKRTAVSARKYYPTDRARYELWADDHGISLDRYPYRITRHDMFGAARAEWAVYDWGRVSMEGHPVAMLYIRYKDAVSGETFYETVLE